MAEQFAGALLTLPDSILSGVVSRTRGRADEFAARFGVQRSFESVANLLADPTIEIVYIATRNEFHKEACWRRSMRVRRFYVRSHSR